MSTTRLTPALAVAGETTCAIVAGALVLVAMAQSPAPEVGAEPGRARTVSAPALGTPADRPLLLAPAAAVEPEPTVVPSSAPRPTRAALRRCARTSPRTAGPSAPALIAPEAVDPERAVRDAIRSAESAFESCYQSALKVDQRVRGRMTVTVSLDPSGAVQSLRIVDSTVRDDQVRRCIARRIRALRFPPVGEEIEVTVPLSLVPRA